MIKPPNEPPRLVFCLCRHCAAVIEFDSSQAGEVVVCQHCDRETTLLVPPISEQKENSPAVPAPGEEVKREARQLSGKKEISPAVPPSVEEVERELEQFKIQKIIQIKTSLRTRLKSGKPAFLCDSIFVPMNPILDENNLADEFNLSILRRLGLIGWDIVQAIPRMTGIGLKNEGTDALFGGKWGGGMGGNVMGVHIIIKKSLSSKDLTDDPADEVGEFIRSHLNDFSTE
jgi:hypothetical protein